MHFASLFYWTGGSLFPSCQQYGQPGGDEDHRQRNLFEWDPDSQQLGDDKKQSDCRNNNSCRPFFQREEIASDRNQQHLPGEKDIEELIADEIEVVKNPNRSYDDQQDSQVDALCKRLGFRGILVRMIDDFHNWLF